MKFTDFVERRTGTYVACNYTQETNQQLAAWCVENLIPVPLEPEKYHTTIIYSRKFITDPLVVAKSVKNLKFNPKDFRLFDSFEDSSKSSLVIEIDAPELITIHKQLIKMGGTHDYDDFTPHVTISYHSPKDLDLSMLKLPSFKFVLNEIYVEPLDFNWKDK